MAEDHKELKFPPGIQRDGTALDSDVCIDGLWTRFKNGRPRKMPGYKNVYSSLSGKPRRVHMFYQNSKIYVHVGTGASLEQIIMDRNGNFLEHHDRTPDVFASGPESGWTLDAMFDSTSKVTQIIAHSSPDISLNASDVGTIPFIGDVTKSDKLKPIHYSYQDDGSYYLPKISGGIACIKSFLFDFDSNGYVGWSAPNLPETLGLQGGSSGAGSARASAQKIIAGMPVRGGSAGPAALFWSLSELILAQFIGTASGGFSFNTVSPSSSILSPQSVIEYNSLYFWAGVDQFMVYNGTVVEAVNNFNADWFFDNINWDAAGKSFAYKVPRFGEIWFCAPLFGATEPSHAAIFNVRENCWYDTELPEGGRGAGYFAQGTHYPVMGGVEKGDTGYTLWAHECGFDKLVDGKPEPIRAYYTTPVISGPGLDPPADEGMSIGQMEPDFIQSGDMTATVTGPANAKADPVDGTPSVIKAIPKTPAEQLIGFKDARRLASIRFESNTLGGNFVAGKTILHTTRGDAHRTGGAAPAIGKK